MKSYQFTIISLILISYVSNANCFSIDNSVSKNKIDATSNEQTDLSNLATDQVKSESDVLDIVTNEKPSAPIETFKLNPFSTRNKRNGKSNYEVLPRPEAKSAVKKVLGFTLWVFIILVLIALFLICGCVFLIMSICCS